MLLKTLLLIMILSKLYQQVHGNSIAFVIDNTFSMKNNIDKVKDTITQLLDTHSDFMRIDKFIFVKFNDVEFLTKLKIYDNRYLFDLELNLINGTEVNLDCPEPSLSGVLMALKRITERNTNIYVFTDASAKDYYRQKNIIELCQDTKAKITFIVTGQCMKDPREFWMYDSIARNCSGNVLVISGDELDQIPLFVRETIKGNATLLLRTETSANRLTDLKFKINNRTDKVIISASGKNVHLVSHAVLQERIMWTDNFKVIKILYPILRECRLLVGGESIKIAVNILAVNDMRATTVKTTGFSSVQPTVPNSINAAKSTPINSTIVKSVKPIESISIKSIESTSIIPTVGTSINPIKSKSIIQMESASINSKEGISISPMESTSINPTEGFKSPVVDISEGYTLEVPLGGTNLVTCKVMGNPKPEIIWTDGKGNKLPSKTITLFAPYLHVSFLNISDVTENRFYACKASNILGNDSKYIEVVLKDRPLLVFENSEVEDKTVDNDWEQTIACRQDEVVAADLKTNANISDQTVLTRKVEEYKQTIDWCQKQNLYCSMNSKLHAKYEWSFNSNPVNQSGDKLEIINVGNYLCRAKDLHGILQIEFTVVVTNCCILNISRNINNYTPFVMTENLTFPEMKTSQNILMVPTNEKVTLICHSQYPKTSPFYRNYVKVTCDHQNFFKFNDLQYTFDEISCDNEVYPIINTLDLRDEGVMIDVGFIAEIKFIKIYSVYIDTAKGGHTIARYDPVRTRKDNFKELHWFDHPKVDKEVILGGGYTCYNDTSVCCYAKRQLVSAKDIAYGAAQTSTYVNNLNSIPYWRTCNGSSETALDNFEQTIKGIYKINTTVWSGASDYISIFEGPVPVYLWKAIKIDDAISPTYFAYVYINEENVESYHVKCTENSYSSLLPNELKNRLFFCKLEELCALTGIPLSTFDE